MELRADLFRDKCILLVKDNPKDEALTIRALQKHNCKPPSSLRATGSRRSITSFHPAAKRRSPCRNWCCSI